MGPGSVILDVLSAEQAYKQEIAHQLCSRVGVLPPLLPTPSRARGDERGARGDERARTEAPDLESNTCLKATPLEERAFP